MQVRYGSRGGLSNRLEPVLAGGGVKEGLVERLTDWPGVHCAQALLTGESVSGYWFDETQAYAARRRGEELDRMRFATLETLTLSPLPCWKHLAEEKQRKLVTDLIAEIEAQARNLFWLAGTSLLSLPPITWHLTPPPPDLHIAQDSMTRPSH